MRSITQTLPRLAFILCVTASACLSNQALAGAEDDPLLAMVMVDQLEYRNAEGKDPLVLQAQAWIGKDLNKIWFKAEAKRLDGKTEEAKIQALYSRAIAPYWDLQVGLRSDLDPNPSRNWGVLAFKGLAPYFFDIDASLFVRGSGHAALRVEAEYEMLFTQKLILSPDIEINVHSKDDADLGVGSGLSDIQAGLRLRYEIRREFAPYVGINWFKKYGNTANLARTGGETVEDWQAVIGLRAWY